MFTGVSGPQKIPKHIITTDAKKNDPSEEIIQDIQSFRIFSYIPPSKKPL
jgi:hypothetical protein